MGIFRSSPSEFASGEREILTLLLQGEGRGLEGLRGQMSAPFLIDVERSSTNRRYTVSHIYDAALESRYSIGSEISVQIDDLVVEDRRLPDALHCKGVVHRGVLVAVLVFSPVDVRWPRRVNVDTWWFLDANGVRTRTRTKNWQQVLSKQPTGKTIVEQLRDAEVRLGVALPQRLSDIGSGHVGLPEGVRAELLRPDELYLVDANKVKGNLLAFAIARDGSLLVFDLDDRQSEAICLLNHETGDLEAVE